MPMKQKVAFALIMGLVTSMIVSFTLVSVNVGYNERFLPVWLRSWAVAYSLVVPAILLLGPQVMKLVLKLFPPNPENENN